MDLFNEKNQKYHCYAEDIAGQVMSANRTQINDYNQTIFDNMNGFLTDIEQQIAGVEEVLVILRIS